MRAQPFQRYASGRLVRPAVRRARGRQALGDIACGDKSTPPTSDARFASSVELWRSLVSAYAGSIPVNFLMAWIQIESCGSVCSYTGAQEAGIFQLMPPDNITVAETSLDAIHPQPPCTPSVPNPFVLMSAISADQQNEQVASGLRYVNYVRAQAHTKLKAAGNDWSEGSPDFWMMVKLQHAYPAPTAAALASASSMLGRAPQNWGEFMMAAQSFFPANSLANAQWTGSFGIGGASIGGMLAWVGLGVLAWMALRA